MSVTSPVAALVWWDRRSGSVTGERLAALVALAASAVWISVPLPKVLAALIDPPGEDRAAASAPSQSVPDEMVRRREYLVGGYGGVSLTLPSTVEIENPGRTDMTIRDFSWIGRPFKSPIYYGLRSQRWTSGSPFGGMIDFTHAKAIASQDDVATLTGVRNGESLPPKARVGDIFRHFEFSHGHNIVTLNGMIRMPALSLPIRPYFGLGAGVSLPHTEIGFQKENQRTYEYQFAGFAGQFLVGLQVPLGRLSVFAEYKFTYAPYSVPLTNDPHPWLLVTDVWRQLVAMYKEEAPPGGVLSTTLMTHHGISGILVPTSSGQ
jgi:hypothetical protein